MKVKFRTFKQNTLWRDKVVISMEQVGSKIHWTKLDDKAFLEQLKLKLTEEVQEVQNAQNKDTLLQELADVLEVVSSFCDVLGMSFEDIVHLKTAKYEKKGGFQGRKFVTVAEHQIGSFGEQYCLADPEKYPEIIE